MRQNEEEMKFLVLINELRSGLCSNDTEMYFKSLQRNLQTCSSEPVHIFFRKLSALMWFNLSILQRCQDWVVSLLSTKPVSRRALNGLLFAITFILPILNLFSIINFVNLPFSE